MWVASRLWGQILTSSRKWELQSYNHRTWILPITWMSQEATYPLSLEISPANVWSSPWWYPEHRPRWSPPCLWLQNYLLIAWVLFEKQELGSHARVRASLVTQWSRIHLPMQETWIWSLIQEDPTKPQLLCPVLQSLGATNAKPMCPRARAQQQRKTPQWAANAPQQEGSPRLPQLEARILEWLLFPSSRWSSWHRDWTGTSYISWIGRWVLYH